jgi:hypothetical protein
MSHSTHVGFNLPPIAEGSRSAIVSRNAMSRLRVFDIGQITAALWSVLFGVGHILTASPNV